MFLTLMVKTNEILLFFQLNVAVLVKLLTPTQDVRDGYDYEEMRLV